MGTQKGNGATGNGAAAGFVRLPWHETADAMMRAHRLLMLVGEPGAGKTTWALEAARRFSGRDPEVVQGTPETELSHLWGTYTLANGETRFLDGPLAAALRRDGVLLVEEMALIPLETRAALLALRGLATVRNPLNGESLAVSPAFRLVATSNPESVRCVRNGKIAQALYDDFLVLEVPLPSEAELRALVDARFADASAERREEAMGLWRRFRDVGERAENKAGVRVGVRAISHWLSLRAAGLDADAATTVAFVNPFFVDEDLHAAAKFDSSIRQS